MRRALWSLILLPSLCVAIPGTPNRLSRKKAAKLHLSVRQVQTIAGNLQARIGTVSRTDADRLNQHLTDVERILTHQS